MPLELILTMQGQFGSCRALRGPLGPQNGLFGPLGLFIWPQSGPKCHIIMFYTCGKCFKVIWGLSWQNTVRSSLYPSWHVIRTKNLNFGRREKFLVGSRKNQYFILKYGPKHVFWCNMNKIWGGSFWEIALFCIPYFGPNLPFFGPRGPDWAWNIKNIVWQVVLAQNPASQSLIWSHMEIDNFGFSWPPKNPPGPPGPPKGPPKAKNGTNHH